jgi:archaemetzincin
MVDIYPKDEWNFVYGEAYINEGLGVYSFARLDPLFHANSKISSSTPVNDADRILILRRSLKVVLHEIGHLFGLHHCIYYSCLMNGTNHEKEMDRQPLYACPVCLHKLYSILRFNVHKTYAKLANLCKNNGLEEEHMWYRKSLECIDERQD